jgi:hypothetical protein
MGDQVKSGRARVKVRDLSETVQGEPEHVPRLPAQRVDILRDVLDDQLTRGNGCDKRDYAEFTGEGDPGRAVGYIPRHLGEDYAFRREPVLIDDGGSVFEGMGVLKIVFRPDGEDGRFMHNLIRRYAEMIVPGGLPEPVTPAKECETPGTVVYAFRRVREDA